jgi:hypothetical protein
MPYPNPYGGLSTGINSAGNSIADALRKIEEQKNQDKWMQMLRSYMGGQVPPGAAATDWGSNVTAPGQTAGTLPPPQTYGGTGYGSPVDWSKMDTGEGSGGSNKAGGNKGGS